MENMELQKIARDKYWIFWKFMSPIRMALSGLLNFDGGKQEGSPYVGVPVSCIVWLDTGLQISPAGVSSISGFRIIRGIVYQVPLLCMPAPFFPSHGDALTDSVVV